MYECVCMYVCMYVCMCMYCMCVYVCMCMFVCKDTIRDSTMLRWAIDLLACSTALTASFSLLTTAPDITSMAWVRLC